MSLNHLEHTLVRIGVEDAERDLLCLLLAFPTAAQRVIDEGITPSMMRDPRHAAFYALLVDLASRTGDHTGGVTLADAVTRVAELRRNGASDELLASAADLDGAFLLAMWTYRVPEAHTWDATVQFLLTAARERLRDMTVEACIAALAHGSNPTLVLERLEADLAPEAALDPAGSRSILSIPPAQEQP